MKKNNFNKKYPDYTYTITKFTARYYELHILIGSIMIYCFVGFSHKECMDKLISL